MSLFTFVVQKWNPVMFEVGSGSEMAVSSVSGGMEGICLKGMTGLAVVCWMAPLLAVLIPLVDGSMLLPLPLPCPLAH